MLAEDPKLVIFIGIVAVAVLASVLPRTQRYGLVFLAMAAVLVLTVAGVVFERLVVTEREQVEAVLDDIASALEDNDVDGVLDHLSPAATPTRTRARLAMEELVITDAGIRNLEVAINRLTSPVTAEARFDGVIRYRFRTGDIGRNFYAARFVVVLQLEEGRWMVTDHIEHTLQSL
jgi:hypothetical protein